MPFERAVRVTWAGTGLRFSGAGTDPVSPPVVVDGDGEAGPGPMQMLLVAAAGCTGSDVALILGKMRVGLERLEVEVTGTRRDEEPRRYIAIHFRFLLVGSGLDEAKAARAVQLSVEKYCSVMHSLASDIAITHEIVLG